VKAAVRFSPVDDNIGSATFELNNALNIARVTDEQGNQIPTVAQSDRLHHPVDLRRSRCPKASRSPSRSSTTAGSRATRNRRFTASSSPPSIPDFAYLMYPARWFPVSGYTTDRFAAEMHITVPAGYTALGTGMDTQDRPPAIRPHSISSSRALRFRAASRW
jgi:hypothetical protein